MSYWISIFTLCFSIAALAAPLDVLDDENASRPVKVGSAKADHSRSARDYVDGGKVLALQLYDGAIEAFSVDSFRLRDQAQSFYDPRNEDQNSHLPGHMSQNPISTNDRELVEGIHASLERARVTFPEADEDFDGCLKHRNTLAFVKRKYDGRIYVCRSLAYGSRTTEFLAETLVHESVHTTGIHDECVTTLVEAAVMRESSLGIVFHNSYWRKCSIR